MRRIACILILALGVGYLASAGTAQQPRDRPAEPARTGPANQAAVDAIVKRMMAFDKNKDGKLTRDEITDERLLRLFDRADINKDGVVTKEELTGLATQMVAEDAANAGRRGGPGGPGGPGGGPGGPGGRGPGGSGPGGPGGFGGPPRPGAVLPPFVRDSLELTPDQAKQLEELQKEVDERLGKILTDEQKKQLQDLRPRGPGGPGGFGRPGGQRPAPPGERPH